MGAWTGNRFPARAGHFIFESGHHGDLWLDLDAIYADPHVTNGHAAALVDLLQHFAPDVICGPMTGGALLAQLVAMNSTCAFAYADRVVRADGSVHYELPPGQIEVVKGRTVIIVDDVINAGNAVGRTHAALISAGARPVAIAALLVLGNAIDAFAEAHEIDVLALERRSSNLWPPDECPLCKRGVPLQSPGGSIA